MAINAVQIGKFLFLSKLRNNVQDQERNRHIGLHLSIQLISTGETHGAVN